MARSRPDYPANWPFRIAVAVAAALPAIACRLACFDPGPVESVLIYGAAVVASAFLLTWAAEAAQVDISASLAIGILALIAVLPEYAVDLYFAFASGHRPDYDPYVAANMTGSNRLLLGIGGPLAVLVLMLGGRAGRGGKAVGVTLGPSNRIELGFLAVAALYCVQIPLTGRISLLDTAVLAALFLLYIRRICMEGHGEEELVGVAAGVGSRPPGARRAIVAVMFLAAAVFILSSAQPFADSLVELGMRLGINRFLLVQWLAPLASEAPELIVAAAMSLRGKGHLAIGALLSSTVNQWTLLLGSLPVAHFLGGGGYVLKLDARQIEELYLTSAQAILGFSLLASMKFGRREAFALLVLFLLQFAFPQREVRLVFSVVYAILAVIILVPRLRHLPPIAASFIKSIPRI